MEDHGEIAERSEVEAEADRCKSESYMCHHYERDTCLIHFKCCPEDVWYACHKCHNQALGLVENLDEKVRENEEPLIEHSEDNFTTNIPGETEDNPNQAETSFEHEDPRNDSSTSGHVERNKTVSGETSDWPSNTEERSSEESSSMNREGLHDDPSTSEKMETNKTETGELSDDPSNDEEGSSELNSSIDQMGLHHDPATSEIVERNKIVTGETSHEQSNKEKGRREENFSQPALDATSPSPKENNTRHSVATALDATGLKCAQCGEKQEFSQYCVSCDNFSFATYFCGECKLLIEKKVDPYHCDDCGICRGGKTNHFHCHVCNVCMAVSLKENHQCFADRGHDPCAICFEEVFSGAVIFPCHHMIHKDCAEQLVLSGSNLCPLCRNVIFQEDEEAVIVEETAQQIPSNEGTFRSSFSYVMKKITGAVMGAMNRCKRGNKNPNRTGSTEREMSTEMTEGEMTNVLTADIAEPETSPTTGVISSTV